MWTLELPFTIPLSMNSRMHHFAKAGHVKVWRNAVHVLAKSAQIPFCPDGVQIALFYTPPDRRRRDPLNLVASLKACEDGIVDAGVVVDDDAAHHTSVMPVITEKGPPRPGGNRIWLEITPVEWD
jgi:crossover junction endodeoxyribonuclease RusA